MPADFATPVKSDVPVLLLSGALDPVTPPANGDDVAKTLPNSRHVVAGGLGHIVSTHGCAPRLIASFVDERRLRQSCRPTASPSLERRRAAAAVARPPRAAAMIDVAGLTKSFGKRGEVHAVADVSFTARVRRDHRTARARTARARRRCCACWRRSSCRTPVARRSAASTSSRDRYAVRERIGVLSDARGLYPRLTARENVRYYGALHGLAGRRARGARRRAARHARPRRARRPAHAGLLAGREDEGRDRARAGARSRRRSCSTSPRTASTS